MGLICYTGGNTDRNFLRDVKVTENLSGGSEDFVVFKTPSLTYFSHLNLQVVSFILIDLINKMWISPSGHSSHVVTALGSLQRNL